MAQRDTRSVRLNDNSDSSGRYVLYWMQASMRAQHNPALETAVAYANERNLPCVAAFSLTDDFPGANLRHYTFLLEGLRETQRTLHARGVAFILFLGPPDEVIPAAAAAAAMVITDRSYLREPRRWRAEVARRVKTAVVQVEGDVVVPVEQASPKEEYSAATLRRKLNPQLEQYLQLPTEHSPQIPSCNLDWAQLGRDFRQLQQDLDRGVHTVLATMRIDRGVRPSSVYRGGFSEAARRLQEFLEQRLSEYHLRRNDPALGWVSNLSAYLHFGQISPVYIARQAQAARPPGDPGLEAFIEELVVRRELSMNFTQYNPYYDQYNCLPDWAQQTLETHTHDTRSELYELARLEQGETADRYWNAAQREMVDTGKMHGYMRMYWGKRLIEWHRTPREAFETAVYLNDKYELDGRDPNGYAGIAWCFGKHDRGWPERPVFGKVRSMTAGGLKRKFDIERYAERWSGGGKGETVT